jgi:hypothetical protein
MIVVADLVADIQIMTKVPDQIVLLLRAQFPPQPSQR